MGEPIVSLEKKTSGRAGLLVNILLLVMACISCVVAGEMVLPVFFSEQIYAEYGGGPGGLRFLKQVKYNSFGYRDVERSMSKDPETVRMVVIGDSFTFGSGIDSPEDVYTRLLERKLNETGSSNKFEVINLGLSTYSTRDELDVLHKLGLKLHPDVVVLGYFINDAEGPHSTARFEEMFSPRYLIPARIKNWLYSRSFMYYFLASRLNNINRALIFKGKSYEDYLVYLYSDANPDFSEHKTCLAQFINTCTEKGIAVIVVNIPLINNFERYPFSYVNRYIQDIAVSNGAMYVDLLSHFSAYDPKELRVSFLDGHMNKLAHKITAEVLCKTLQEKRIIPGLVQ